MSPTSVEAHHQKWSDLPLFPEGQWVVSQDDIDAWNDLTYLRDLVDTILRELDTPEQTRQVLAGPPTADGGGHDGRGCIEFDIDTYLEPWPAIDRAADMLTAWRANPGPGPIAIDIYEVA